MSGRRWTYSSACWTLNYALFSVDGSPLGRELGWLSGFALQAREERERGRAPAAADQ
ncbi:MAG: hypothetical protein RXP27_03745 [Nitrososphaeria archaeon]